MTDRLVCAVDATPESAGAVCAACAIARVLGMRTVLVHVAEPHGRSTDPARARGSIELERSLAGLALPPDAIRRVEVGDPAELVTAAADDEGAGLIVAGTRRARARAKALFGSVASRIVELADAPVVIAPRSRRDSALAGELHPAREVLIAVDGSDEGRAAAALAGRLARRARARIVLCHVVPPLPPAAAPPAGIVPPITDNEGVDGWRILEDARQVIPDGDVVDLELKHGLPARELEELARDRGTDLIALGTRRPGPAQAAGGGIDRGRPRGVG